MPLEKSENTLGAELKQVKVLKRAIDSRAVLLESAIVLAQNEFMHKTTLVSERGVA